MSYSANTHQISALDSKIAHIPKNIVNAIKTASSESGVDFSYLLNQAKAESSFNPTAKAKTSSATGLYQFIDSTWIEMVNKYGDEYGIDTKGKSRSDILQMRKDPEKASFMAAAFASENEKALNNNWGGDVGATELYFAHFMGASGATAFLNARDENPIARASDLFPKAARANRGVFYDPTTHKPRTLEQVYQFFDKKFQTDTPQNKTQIANVPIPDKKPSNSVAALGHHQIMVKSHAMRQAAYSGGHGQVSGREFFLNQDVQNRFSGHDSTTNLLRAEAKKSPFFSLIAQPIDLMLLTQTTTPSKVISDKA